MTEFDVLDCHTYRKENTTKHLSRLSAEYEAIVRETVRLLNICSKVIVRLLVGEPKLCMTGTISLLLLATKLSRNGRLKNVFFLYAWLHFTRSLLTPKEL